MNQRLFTLAFLGLLVIGSATVMVNKFKDQTSATSLPSPASDNNPANATNQAVNSPSVPVTSLSPSPTPKAPKQFNNFTRLTPDQIEGKQAKIETAKGTIEFSFYPEATKAASSFIFLANNHFFDGLTFHRVEKGFVIQGGDPLGNGTGGPGYQFPDELSDNRTYTRGTVAMANAGPNTNGSQFFIMLGDHPELPHNYTIFGKVTSGMEVVDKISVGDVMEKVTIE